MRTLYVRDVPDKLHARLKRLAARNRRSLSAEVMVLIDRAIEQELSREDPLRVLAKIAERRRSYTPPAGSKDSVELVREDRNR